MEDRNYKTLKEELNSTFSDEYIRNVSLLIHQMAEQFYEEQKLEGKVYFDDIVFEYCLIDILEDIARLRHFHDIELVNYVKLMAYTASWCLKRKPFQMIEGASVDYIYVNERFALSLLLQASGCFDSGIKCAKEDVEKVEKLVEQIFYHLKYRNTNPQTLELLLVGIENGKLLYNNSRSN